MTLTLISTREPVAFGEARSLNSTAPTSAVARIAQNQTLADGRGEAGIWECSPGEFRRQVLQAEYSYIISGEGSFTPEGGARIHFTAGDVLYFSANTHGTWEIRSTVRKNYFILT